MELDIAFYVAIGYGIFAFITLLYFVKRTYRVSERKVSRKSEKKNKFFRAVANGLSRDLIKSPKDIEKFFDSIFRTEIESEEIEEDYEFYSILELLKEFSTKFTEDYKTVFKGTLSNTDIKKFNDKINGFIAEFERKEEEMEIGGLEILPVHDRNLLKDIKIFIEKNMDEPAIEKIDDLEDLLIDKNDEILDLKWELDDTKRTEKFRNAITIVSIIFTIVVGIIGLMF